MTSSSPSFHHSVEPAVPFPAASADTRPAAPVLAAVPLPIGDLELNALPSAPSSSEAHPPKSLFACRTFWGALLTAIAAVTPAVGECVAEYQRTGQVDAHRVANTVVILATTGLTIVGRVGASDAVYTPRGIPGPNRPR